MSQAKNLTHEQIKQQEKKEAFRKSETFGRFYDDCKNSGQTFRVK